MIHVFGHKCLRRLLRIAYMVHTADECVRNITAYMVHTADECVRNITATLVDKKQPFLRP
ncbi:hypothetical protein DPMN_177641 [Dreissena polymorpha]|uniref:Uncharacterized protein n=1 Tax=Dreissena polymorpha TaxID=45954 RepID=A0A9D4EAK9_DREPO|nr:hypothetical protein DPMN_177641 [Dreissena polymorpha]